ncbi:MAG TPA: PaaX family transcriptional regulator C-terminal domain-containing protein [Longimicrobiaceae bacterium]
MRSQRPQDLIFTLFGDYLLHQPGWVWVGSLIELLRPLGLSPGAARTTLSRMGAKGWLDTLRVGRRSYYELTARGRHLLEAGEARIHHPPRDEAWDGLWYLVSYSVPEEQRQLRDRLRVRLQWLGFGQLGNGLWISPHRVRGEVNELAGELGVAEHVEVFRAQYQGWSSMEHLVSTCWDLGAVDRRYEAFLARHGEAAERVASGAERPSPEEAYVRRFWLVHEYREFPLIDPYLPERLLPAGWHGERASELFERYHGLLTGAAERYVDSVLELYRVAPARGA